MGLEGFALCEARQIRDTAGVTTRAQASRGFSEKDFYLAEFRARTLALALPRQDAKVLAPLEDLLGELGANDTRAVLLSCERAPLEKLVGGATYALSDPRWLGRVWRELRTGTRAGLVVESPESLPSACRRVALRLGLVKLVWIDPDGGLVDAQGGRVSFVDLRALDGLIRGGQAPHAGASQSAEQCAETVELLKEIRAMLEGGLPAVNLCSPAGLASELFSYAGSGTFFTRERYTEVRDLAIDEFEAAEDLMRRGVADGYLLERSGDDQEAVLIHAFGAFIEGRFLAGIGALLPHAEDSAGEISGLYTLTRFLGEGVGGELVRFALDRAREAGLAYVFACTTSDRVRAFFERNGFRCVSAAEIPAEKWAGYDAARREALHCLRRELAPPD